MNKIFKTILFVSAFTLLSSATSQATSMEFFSFTGAITSESDTIDPGFPKVGDKFAGQFTYIYDPTLKPDQEESSIYYPKNFYYLLFDDFHISGSADFSWGYKSAGNEMTFMDIPTCSAFEIEDLYIEIGEQYGSIDIIPLSNDRIVGRILGSVDNVIYSSITINSQPVPEPSTILLLCTGLTGFLGLNLLRKK